MPATVESATSATGPSPGTSSPRRSPAGPGPPEPVERPELVVDRGGRENHAVDVTGRDDRVGDRAVDGLALHEQAPKLVFVAGERPIRPARPPPREIDVHVEEDGERSL